MVRRINVTSRGQGTCIGYPVGQESAQRIVRPGRTAPAHGVSDGRDDLDVGEFKIDEDEEAEEDRRRFSTFGVVIYER